MSTLRNSPQFAVYFEYIRFIAPATRLGMSKPQVLKAAVIIFLIALFLKFLFLLFVNYMISLCGFSAWGLGLWFYVNYSVWAVAYVYGATLLSVSAPSVE
jgi:uncharacterized membrane protein